ncbi:DUF6588 family protein [uncultured Sunxiuqinia sp.]|uniref:DUF6588 family protein n=1 Tax=uncultured Sunxiuqinia sp. TaxID=1573825 RepID=UPI00260C522C|nr:DUF6588 family protein [uncultured Sunxiuqinia sp.]
MRKLLVLLSLTALVSVASAQSDVVEYLKAGPEDASLLIQSYMNPFAQSLGDGLNNGWYYTAETHKRFGFDFSMSVSAVKVPGSAKSFDLSQFSFENIALADPSNSMAPTISGNDAQGPTLNVLNPDNNNQVLYSFNAPGGTEIDIVPVPVAQLGIGLLPHTDVLVRYVPELKFNLEDDSDEETKVGMFGLGVKHSFKDWIPGLKHLPFDAAVFASYSNITANTGISFTPEDYDSRLADLNTGQYENQELDIETKTKKFGLIVSKKIAILTIFGSIGNSQSSSKVDLLGTYPVPNDFNNAGLSFEDQVDPIKLRFESSNLSLDAGLRLKLAFFNIFASVNKAEYTSYNAGIALSVR